MENYIQKSKISLLTFLTILFITNNSFATTKKSTVENKTSDAVVANNIFNKANANTHWKMAFLTGKHAQVVFMNVSTKTNPKNEIGTEIHPFDQVIIVTEGAGKAILNGKTSTVKTGDMIFIPQGTKHNVINSNPNKELKIISIYSDTDIPANSVYKKKSD